ncbi:ankyrin repeat domain-containing protein 65-like [Schistocerca americana]|uniref:ankyrin repeat domain-containing protein 65-like n=1 Tax=Schistocerca americana TaxID=7009 RepID=UPI001F4F48E7|nr:ankyrin repeat domain-containing protein 65-like [Schistocerca americana]
MESLKELVPSEGNYDKKCGWEPPSDIAALGKCGGSGAGAESSQLWWAAEVCQLRPCGHRRRRRQPLQASQPSTGGSPADARLFLQLACATPQPPACADTAVARPTFNLVSAGRGLSQQERGRRLIEAAVQGAAEQLRELLAAGADVGSRGEGLGSSWTALHWAARGGHVAAASCLVGAGAEVDARESWGQWTPLHLAAEYGHAGVVRLLVGASADLNARDVCGQTPLHCAAVVGHAEAAAELLLAGADRGARDVFGWTPLDIARLNGNQELVDKLRQR